MGNRVSPAARASTSGRDLWGPGGSRVPATTGKRMARPTSDEPRRCPTRGRATSSTSRWRRDFWRVLPRPVRVPARPGARLTTCKPANTHRFPRERGGIGRRTRFRFWRGHSCEGSSPSVRTQVATRSSSLFCTSWARSRFGGARLRLPAATVIARPLVRLDQQDGANEPPFPRRDDAPIMQRRRELARRRGHGSDHRPRLRDERRPLEDPLAPRSRRGDPLLL
jgi:hypothetical protein